MKNKKTLGWIGTIFFTILGLIYIAPIIIVLLNSFKKKSFINLEPFKLPSAKNFHWSGQLYNCVGSVWPAEGCRMDSIYYCGFCYRYSDLYFYVRMGNYPSEE